MNTFNPVTESDLAYFRSLLPGRVFSGADISTDYDHDEMTEYGHFLPEAVLQALTAEEICAVLKYCNERRIPVTPRGAGTGLCGGCVAIHGGIVLSTEKMKKVLEVDTRNMTATVEPGVLLMEFPKALEGTGLFYPPDPGEKTATMGGNAMTNAGGMRAVRYGVTRDYVLGMEVALADGSLIELGGKTVKTSSGYSLIDLMIGSEGTLGFLTKLTVKLIPEPKVNLSLLMPFDDLDACIGAVPKVLSCGCDPTAVEFMEREVISCAETYLGKQFPDTSADAYLLVRLDGPSVEALQPAIDALTDLALSIGGIPMTVRLLRGSILTVRKQEYIEAAEKINCSKFRVIMSHILPNSIAPVIVSVTMGIGNTILQAASLSYIGLGVQPPTPEWGAMLSEGKSMITKYPHLCIFPGLAIMLVVLCLNMLGDGLRDAMDPKLKN